jgi:cytochrome c-type biogenesis protein CcmH/NrfG
LSFLTRASDPKRTPHTGQLLLVAIVLAAALSGCRADVTEEADATPPAETAAESLGTPAASSSPDAPQPAEATLTGEQAEAIELLERGRTLLDNDQCEEALVPLEMAVRLDPGLADAHLTLGNAYARTAQVESAIDAYNAAISIDPDFS